jgi:hypothetical protein
LVTVVTVPVELFVNAPLFVIAVEVPLLVNVPVFVTSPVVPLLVYVPAFVTVNVVVPLGFDAVVPAVFVTETGPLGAGAGAGVDNVTVLTVEL